MQTITEDALAPGPTRLARTETPEPAFSPLAMLDTTLAARDLILVTGKGGTGKSTLVAALAELAARRRGGAAAVEVSAHPRLSSMIRPGVAVEVLNIDAEVAVAPALGRLLRLPAVVAAVLNNRILRLFIRTSPAFREMIVLDEIYDLVERSAKRGRPVIVDLPASGHALSFLDTPRSVHRMLRVGPLAQVARRIEELILDRRRTELVIVALPEELPVNETIEAVRRAAEIGIVSRTVVVNQVPSANLDAGDRSLLETVRQHNAGALSRFAGAAHSELEGIDLARVQIDRLKHAVSAAVIEVPEMRGADLRVAVDTLVEALTL
jgi:arsenite/tail-anchored protein-transporting ATPase